jgi:hypothetical protein
VQLVPRFRNSVCARPGAVAAGSAIAISASRSATWCPEPWFKRRQAAYTRRSLRQSRPAQEIIIWSQEADGAYTRSSKAHSPGPTSYVRIDIDGNSGIRMLPRVVAIKVVEDGIADNQRCHRAGASEYRLVPVPAPEIIAERIAAMAEPNQKSTEEFIATLHSTHQLAIPLTFNMKSITAKYYPEEAEALKAAYQSTPAEYEAWDASFKGISRLKRPGHVAINERPGSKGSVQPLSHIIGKAPKAKMRNWGTYLRISHFWPNPL